MRACDGVSCNHLGLRTALVRPLLAICCLASTAAGCRQEPTTVSGSVTLDGQPLSIRDGMRGTVVYQPAGGGAVLNGMIDDDGEYHLYSGSNRFVVPGTYAVTVSAVRVNPPTSDNPQPSGERVTPAKYANASQSGLRTEVSPGPNDIDLNLISETKDKGNSETRGEQKPDSTPPPRDEETQ